MKNCDRIIVLEDGKIVEEGTPDHLMGDAKGRFYRMYSDQKMDSLKVESPKKHLVKGKRSIGAADVNQVFLVGKTKKQLTHKVLGPRKT